MSLGRPGGRSHVITCKALYVALSRVNHIRNIFIFFNHTICVLLNIFVIVQFHAKKSSKLFMLNLASETYFGKYLVFQEATLNTLVAVEVACWFFVGEVIGKGTLVGYQIPGAVDFEVHI